MGARLSLQRRQDAADHELRPGEYRQLTAQQRFGNIATAIFRCPLCGHLTLAARHIHGINYLGEVEPMVYCPSRGCSFGASVEMADWIPESKGSA